MAGMRKLVAFSLIVCNLLLIAVIDEIDALSTQCLSASGKAVDWYIVYKLPKPHGDASYVTDAFMYMDVSSPEWHLSDLTMDQPGHAVYNTLNQIYKSQAQNTSYDGDDLLYLMYNDEPSKDPDEFQSKKYHWWTSSYGHTKGVVAFDSSSGFWLVHSTPHFPPPRSQHYSWPASAQHYGQTFLCISMETAKNADEVGKQLMYNQPDIYDHFLPDSMATKYPNMANAIARKHVTTSPWQRQTQLHSLAGTVFQSFAKNDKFDADLYSVWLAPVFHDTLMVETWQNGIHKLCSNCTGQYKVYNIESLSFQSAQINFTETDDHAKWAITSSGGNPWTCIGDINRQLSQEKRPGGTVCFQHAAVWKNFHSLIASYHDCHPYRKCVEGTTPKPNGNRAMEGNAKPYGNDAIHFRPSPSKP